jgi:hypothetical protein
MILKLPGIVSLSKIFFFNTFITMSCTIFTNNPGVINHTGCMIVQQNSNANITNTAGTVTITQNFNQSGTTLSNTGGAVVIGQAATGAAVTNNCNITIGTNANGSPLNITGGVLSIGNSFIGGTVNLNGNSVFILVAGIQTTSTYNFVSGSNDLLIDTAITGTGSQTYASGGISFNGFNYLTNSIILPSIHGPYSATYVGTTLTITGTGSGGATYQFNNFSGTGIPASLAILPIVPTLAYSFVTPAVAASLSNSITTPPNPTTQTYSGDFYFGAFPITPPCSVCIAEGTNILTKDGFVKIENLKKGDKIMVLENPVLNETGFSQHTCPTSKVLENPVLNETGFSQHTCPTSKVLENPVLNETGFSQHTCSANKILENDIYIPKSVDWIGKFYQTTNDMFGFITAPIRIKKSAIADNIPSIDLLLSPGHSILLDDILIQAQSLVNGTTIYQDYSFTGINYYHIKLDAHYIINAEGVNIESYFDVFNSNRKIFEDNPEIEDEPLEVIYSSITPDEIITTKCAKKLAYLNPDSIGPIKKRLDKRAKNIVAQFD